jgi:hypothetical protein
VGLSANLLFVRLALRPLFCYYSKGFSPRIAHTQRAPTRGRMANLPLLAEFRCGKSTRSMRNAEAIQAFDKEPFGIPLENSSNHNRKIE